MTDKIVKLTAIEGTQPAPEVIDPDLLATIEDFLESAKAHNIKGFAAVGINEAGVVVDAWHSTMPEFALLGAIEAMKNDFSMNQWVMEQEDE